MVTQRLIDRLTSILGKRVQSVRDSPVHQLQLAMLTLPLLLLGGTLGYMFLEGMDWDAALYMTVITLTTVGFGEVVPLSPVGRLFTMVLIVLGIGTAAWAIRNAATMLLGQQLWISVQQRRMDEERTTMRNHSIVCGYGRIGRQIVRDLRAREAHFVVIDASVELETIFLDENIPYVIGDATQDEILEAAGIERARGFVAALESDAENVLAVLTARGLNSGLLIIARTASESAERKLYRAGANRVVNPYVIGGHRLTLALLRPITHDFLKQIFSADEQGDVDVGQIRVRATSPLVEQTLADCALWHVWNLNVLAIQRPDGTFVTSPEATHRIRPGETLIVIGPRDAIYQLEDQYKTDWQNASLNRSST